MNTGQGNLGGKRREAPIGADAGTDFIGFGKTDSWPGPGELSHDDQAALIASLITEECTAPVHMVGHSYGGAVAVRLALAHPEILGRLVLIEPVLTPLLNLDGREDIFEEYRLMAQAFLEYGRRDDDEAAWQGFIDYRNGAGAWAALPEKARSSSALARGRQWTRSFRTSPIKHRWTIAGRFRYRR